MPNTTKMPIPRKKLSVLPLVVGFLLWTNPCLAGQDPNLLGAALFHWTQGDIDQARELYHEAARSTPTALVANIALARIALEFSDPANLESAKPVLEAALKIKRTSECLRLYGDMQRLRKLDDPAAEDYYKESLILAYEEASQAPTSDERARGTKILEEILASRPQMAAYCKKGDRIWNWTAARLGKNVLGMPLVWDAQATRSRAAGEIETPASDTPYFSLRLSPDPNSKAYPGVAEISAGERLWAALIYEMNNFLLQPSYVDITLRAVAGRTSGFSYAAEFAALEALTCTKTQEFYAAEWFPALKAKGLPSNSRAWTSYAPARTELFVHAALNPFDNFNIGFYSFGNSISVYHQQYKDRVLNALYSKTPKEGLASRIQAQKKAQGIQMQSYAQAMLALGNLHEAESYIEFLLATDPDNAALKSDQALIHSEKKKLSPSK